MSLLRTLVRVAVAASLALTSSAQTLEYFDGTTYSVSPANVPIPFDINGNSCGGAQPTLALCMRDVGSSCTGLEIAAYVGSLAPPLTAGRSFSPPG